jgi:hypothetical protein
MSDVRPSCNDYRLKIESEEWIDDVRAVVEVGYLGVRPEKGTASFYE